MVMILDLSGEACPVPLVKSRRAMDKMESGEILEIIVTNEDSKANIVMAAEELGMEVKRVNRDKNGRWHVIVRKK
ncbi:MAG: SirA-like domain-containing protein [Candidatus Bathyarchaeota archaeon B26-2]|nr:MAG: SirA-like domain-containing protein [Candidatus Bathyarchaeota archaeon B26-2]